jgi:hypothetical protein
MPGGADKFMQSAQARLGAGMTNLKKVPESSAAFRVSSDKRAASLSTDAAQTGNLRVETMPGAP